VVNSSDQMIRYWIDTILQLTRDGLKKPILIAYKNRFPNSYMTEIQEKLRNLNGHYPPDIFTSDDLLLAKLDDPKAWLDLMSRRWNDLFLQKSGSTGKRHVENLKDVRDKWAHSAPLTVQDAYSAAVTAINLLKDFQCDKAVQDIRAIFSELDKTQYVDPASPQVAPEPAVQPSVEALSTVTATVEIAAPSELMSPVAVESAVVVLSPTAPEAMPVVEELTENTDRIHAYPENGDFYIQIIGLEGETYDQKIPAPLDRLVIGRSATAHLNLSDPRVSRVHLLLAQNGAGLTLTDLRSANGTQLEGSPLPPNQPTHWQPGQVVALGGTLLVLRRGM
jgi:hypothetical protein